MFGIYYFRGSRTGSYESIFYFIPIAVFKFGCTSL